MEGWGLWIWHQWMTFTVAQEDTTVDTICITLPGCQVDLTLEETRKNESSPSKRCKLIAMAPWTPPPLTNHRGPPTAHRPRSQPQRAHKFTNSSRSWFKLWTVLTILIAITGSMASSRRVQPAPLTVDQWTWPIGVYSLSVLSDSRGSSTSSLEFKKGEGTLFDKKINQ